MAIGEAAVQWLWRGDPGCGTATLGLVQRACSVRGTYLPVPFPAVWLTFLVNSPPP